MDKILHKMENYFGRFEFAVLDSVSGRWVVDGKPQSIRYLRHENAQGRHILVKPTGDLEPTFLLVDDLDERRMRLDHEVGGQ